jgi:hypothetical protein
MRAIVHCYIEGHKNIDSLKSDFGRALDANDWLPSIGEEHPLLLKHKDEILNLVANSDVEFVKETFYRMVHEEKSGTWGLVNNPSPRGFTFRLKNPDPGRLKIATEKLVANLAAFFPDRLRSDLGKIDFDTKIVVLEPQGEHPQFFGEILPAKGLGLAMRERKTETYVGLLTLLLGMGLLILTSPVVASVAFSVLSPPWQDWLNGNLSRFATAAWVTTTISWFEVLLHWFSVRRQNSIRWTLE